MKIQIPICIVSVYLYLWLVHFECTINDRTGSECADLDSQWSRVIARRSYKRGVKNLDFVWWLRTRNPLQIVWL